MFYKSTRGGASKVTFSQAVKKGIAPDGGLFVPDEGCVLTDDEFRSMVSLSYKELAIAIVKKFASDFKNVYNAPTETAALTELEIIKEKWGKKYPYAISNWEKNWDDLSSFFQFSGDIRRIMYTTNIIEGLNRQYRKVTKTKSVFPSDSSLEKMLFLASRNITKKWTQRYRNWDQVLGQLILLFEERITIYL